MRIWLYGYSVLYHPVGSTHVIYACDVFSSVAPVTTACETHDHSLQTALIMENQFQENRTFWTGHFGERGHFGVRTFIEIRRNVLFFLKQDISAKEDISVSNTP